jgi:predicted DNA-binding protein
MRIDAERMERLEHVAKQEGKTVSEIARRLLDLGYEDWMKERRKAAVRHIAEANIEDVPDPEELSRQLDATHDIPDPYRR